MTKIGRKAGLGEVLKALPPQNKTVKMGSIIPQ
jgi:hypothetical protein